MREQKIRIVTYLFVALFAYSGFWLYTAKNRREYLRQSLNSVADSNLVKSFEYRDVKSSGYPFKVNLSIEKPKIKLNANALYSQSPLFAHNATTHDSLEIIFDDAFVVDGSLIGSSHTLKPRGDIHVIQHSNADKKHYLISDSDGAAFAVSKGVLKGIAGTLNQKKAQEISDEQKILLFIGGGKKYTYDLSGIKIEDYVSKEVLFKNKIAKMSVQMDDLQADKARVQVVTEMQDIDIHPKIYSWFNQLSDALQGTMGQTQLNGILLEDTHTKITANYHGPMMKDKIRAGEQSLNFDINVYVNGKLGEFNHEGTLKLKLDEGAFKTAKINLDNHFQYEPAYKEYLKSVFELKRNGAYRYPEMVAPQQLMFLDLIADNSDMLFPNFHELGKTDSQINLDIQTSDFGNVIKVNNFYVKNDVLTFKTHGQFDYQENVYPPRADLYISVSDDEVFAESLDRFFVLIGKVNEKMGGGIDERIYSNSKVKTKEYFKVLAQKEDGADKEAEFHLMITNAPIDLKINKRNSEQLASLFNDIYLSDA